MYDESHEDTIELAGSLLLAHPHLKDPNFASTVVLLTAHEEAGSLGVVLNRFTGKRLRELSPDFEELGLGDIPIYEGGPVNQDQLIIAAWKTLTEEGAFKLYFGMEPVVAQSKMQTDPDLEFRAFKGYSGWGEGQLMGELEDNAWVVSDVDAGSISKLEGEQLWRHLIMEVNPELGLISLEPKDPDSN
ncbi:YqgE/AlgH family protein [Pelagicoccus sp. SDUM812003]|uniref:YqgE/AlgH family protein n=1 Tax=Pelagicoccus sp. SDUM812003 TaxID=3041267 RepID=UPI00280F92B4|nr:YqgE/AlgH family protein [Pelagicoccus sp. SDUM812003]MDQ8203759.1 YqgE/AlgH family protein [Pelagicoccus sp. SDUM812003]